MGNNIEHPDHYNRGGVECIDAMMAAAIGLTGPEAVCVSNIIKYVWRYKFKNGKEDLKKARVYLDILINNIEEK